MKYFPTLLTTALVVTSFSVFANDCDNKTGCDAKACQIEKQIELAKQYDNENKLEGLNKALKQVQSYCTNDDLKDELQDKIDDVKEDMAEHQHDLDEAIQDQKMDKIEKYKHKLSEDRQELTELKQELSRLK